MTQRRPFAGWWVVASVFLLLMTTSGLGFYGLAVYLDALTAEQDISTGAVSLAISMFFVISGVSGQLVAGLIEKYDVRIFVAVGGVISAVALFLIGRVDGLATLYPTYALFAVGFAMSGLIPATTLVTRWFRARRSVALAIASSGLSVGGITFTQFASFRIDRDGLADATPVLAGLYVAAVGVALLTMWPDPASRGTTPDGGAETDASADQAASYGYQAAISSRFFRWVTVGFVFAMGSQVGGITQLAKLGTERVDRASGALAVSAVAVTSVVARLIGGVVAGRVEMMRLVTVLSAVQGAALASLAFVDGRVTLVAAAVLFGATIGNLLMLQPLIIAEAFGVASYARIFALNQLVVTAGIAGGPVALGVLHDVASYRVSYLVAASVSLVGAVVFAGTGSIATLRRGF